LGVDMCSLCLCTVFPTSIGITPLPFPLVPWELRGSGIFLIALPTFP